LSAKNVYHMKHQHKKFPSGIQMHEKPLPI
jgi:hypothetical protein